jgi:cell division protein FtsA
MGLRTPMEQAERIKQKHGCALTSMVDKQEMIEVPSVGGREPRVMGRQILTEILEPRVEEIFQLVHHEIERNGFSELLASGVVITGGSTLLPGMPELAEEIMGVPVRRGVPRGIGGLVDVVKSPVYATGVGLVVYGAKNLDRRMFRIRESENVFKKVKRRMGEWLQEVF